jgi:phage-related minor tail protein
MGKKVSLESLEAERNRLAFKLKDFGRKLKTETVQPICAPMQEENSLLKAVETALEKGKVLSKQVVQV